MRFSSTQQWVKTSISAIILSASTLGNAYADTHSISQPVVHLGTEYSSAYGYLAHAELANTWSYHNAAAFLFDFGNKQVRLGINWAHQFSDTQRLKIGLEHFAQSIDFDFTSGKDHESVGQNAIGADYQYLTHSTLLHSWDLGAYYAQAQNANFKNNVVFSTPAGNFLDIRDVAGAKVRGFSLGPELTLWSSARLSADLNYDNVDFSANNEPNQRKSGLGATLSLQQNLGSHILLKLAGSDRKAYDLYQMGVNWLLRQKTDNRLELGVYAARLQSDLLPVHKQTIVGLQLAYSWDNPAASQQALTNRADANDALVNWVAQTSAHLPAVYAMRDQKVVAAP